MSCQTCEFWKLIGQLEDVYQYKDNNENLSEDIFAELLPRGSEDDTEYGYCVECEYAGIKPSTSFCVKEKSKN